MHEFNIVLTQLKESSNAALSALWRNKVRTLLSTLGISIGIFCIIAVLSVVQSFQVSLEESVESLGKDVVFIEKWPWEFSGPYRWWKYMNRPNPTLSELRTVQQRSEMADAGMLTIALSNRTLKYETNTASGIEVQGVTFDFYQVRNFDLQKGRYFTESEVDKGENVVLLGSNLAETLFPNIGATDRILKITGNPFRVIGIFKKEGESLIGNSLDNVAVIPVQSAAKYIRINSDFVNSRIHMKAKPMAGVDLLQEELNGIMRAQRKLRPGEEADFALNKTTLISKPIKETFETVNVAGWVIGLFAMLVGGFGIANIMFVSVKERTNEIGIQKSLGAKNYFILIEFLVEAVILCLFGCFIGLMLVLGIIAILNSSFDFRFFLSFGNIMTGILTSIFLGILAGIIPALMASRLNPVDAIRSK